MGVGVSAESHWSALAHARRRTVPRVGFFVDGKRVGSVATAHLRVLSRWPDHLLVGEQAVHLRTPVAERDEALAQMHAQLREDGCIVAWRDEPFALLHPDTGQSLATIERAAARFWGTLTLGAHCNGWVANAQGQPERMWIARRSAHKATDPGLLDNLVGGGVPLGQSPRDTVVREGFEEAGLSPQQMARVTAHEVIELDRDVPEGRQFERLHVFDLALPPGQMPVNQDGEVAELRCLPIEEALSLACTPQMTVDASLVTLAFALRRGLIRNPPRDVLAAATQRLWTAGAVDPAS